MKKPMMFLVVLMLLGSLCSSAQATEWWIAFPVVNETLDEDNPVNAGGTGPDEGVAWLEVKGGSGDRKGMWVDVYYYLLWDGAVDPPSGGWGTGGGLVELWPSDVHDPVLDTPIVRHAVTFEQ